MVPQSPEALFIDGNFFDLSLCAPSSSFFSRSVASCCQIRSATSTDLFFFSSSTDFETSIAHSAKRQRTR
jgi:hypothetical protein